MPILSRSSAMAQARCQVRAVLWIGLHLSCPNFSGDTMATIYTTRQGETVDLACLAFYGRTAKVVEAVIDTNPGLAALGPVLPLGTKITMPDIPATSTAKPLTSLWD